MPSHYKGSYGPAHMEFCRSTKSGLANTGIPNQSDGIVIQVGINSVLGIRIIARSALTINSIIKCPSIHGVLLVIILEQAITTEKPWSVYVRNSMGSLCRRLDGPCKCARLLLRRRGLVRSLDSAPLRTGLSNFSYAGDPLCRRRPSSLPGRDILRYCISLELRYRLCLTW